MARQPKAGTEQAVGYPIQQGIANDENVTRDRMTALKEWLLTQDRMTQMNFLTMVDLACAMPAEYLDIINQCPDPIMKRHLLTAVAARTCARALSK